MNNLNLNLNFLCTILWQKPKCYKSWYIDLIRNVLDLDKSKFQRKPLFWESIRSKAACMTTVAFVRKVLFP